MITHDRTIFTGIDLISDEELKRRAGLARTMRLAIIARDGNKCHWCHNPLPTHQATLEHLISKDDGGETTMDNCVVSCKPCNAAKGKMGHRRYESIINRIIRSERAKAFWKDQK